jgi:hypothetical protein
MGASVAPPPIFPPPQPEPAATTGSVEHREGELDVGHCARLPALIANGPSSVIRVRVVLLPHATTEPTDTRPTNRRAGRVNDMNREESPRHHPAQNDGTIHAITASRQWHDAELAMKVARHSFERWLVADHEDTPSLAIMHAHHTRVAVREAARTIAMLIETLGADAAALVTTSARRTDILPERR